MYEVVLLNSIEMYAELRGLFSKMQFWFHEGVGCIEAIIFLNEEVKSQSAFSIFAKHLTQFGLTV